MGKPLCLTWNMRNSIEIYELIEATKKVLSGVKTNFVHPDNNKAGDQANSIKESAGESSVTNGFLSTKEDPKELEYEGNHERKGQSDENFGDYQIGLDESHAVAASSMVDKTGVNKTVTSFSYTKVHKTGHQIKTKTPVLFELGNKKEFEKHLSLLVIFEKILNIYNLQVVLHFDTMHNTFPGALRFAFDRHFCQKKITTNYEEFKSSNQSILVCSYPTFRGLEHPIITVLIDRDIYHLQHYLVEMIARCTTELYVVVLQNSEALKTVTDVWKSNKLVDKYTIETTADLSGGTDLLLEHNEKAKIIRGIFPSEKYKQLEKEFRKFSSTSEDEVIAMKKERIAKERIDKR